MMRSQRPQGSSKCAGRFPPFLGIAACCLLFGIASMFMVDAAGDIGIEPRCSSCSLNYEPVVDVNSGLPFFNDCLARCRPGGDKATYVPAAKRDVGDANGKVPPFDFFQTLPVPSKPTGKDGALDRLSQNDVTEDTVTANTIYRYADDGYVFVGRAEQPAASSGPGALGKVITKDRPFTTKQSLTSSEQAKKTGVSDGDTILAMRMVPPYGDVYMRVITPQERKALIQTYAKNSNFARLAMGSPGTSNTSINSSSTNTTVPRSSHRRLHTHSSNSIFDGDSRWEVTSVQYPNRAVTWLNYRAYDSTTGQWGNYMCSGALVGPTGRLVLTAGHCLFDGGYWGNSFRAAPGHNRNGAPYGWHDAEMAETWTAWTDSRNRNYDIGLLRLRYHVTNPGSLGFTYNCGNQWYSLTSTGYPGDKNHGSMWTQSIGTSDDVCSGDALHRFRFDSAKGQSGSPFWTLTNGKPMARFVLVSSSTDWNGAVAINPTYYSWMLDYQRKNIINTPTRILVGGGNQDLFVRCDTTSWRCVGVRSRSSATRFYAYPIASTDNFALQIPGTTLCLNLWGGGSSGQVALYTCNTGGDFSFGNDFVWYSGFSSGAGGINVLRSLNNAHLWWDGDNRDLRGVNACWWAWQCTWRLQAP